jgi:hypothetical protein
MKLPTILLLVASSFLQCSPIVLNCEFEHLVLFDDRKISYTCAIEKLQFTTNSTFRTVENVSGGHLRKHSNEDVMQVHLLNQNMEVLAVGLTKFFKNLVAVHAGMNNLKYLEKDDLSELSNLRFLYLYHNKLEVLKSDVFEHTKSLEYVSLHSNHLKYIGAKILLPLKQLRTAYFNRNTCIDKQASSDQGMSELRQEIATSCSEITDEDLMEILVENKAKIDELQALMKETAGKLSKFVESFNKTN